MAVANQLNLHEESANFPIVCVGDPYYDGPDGDPYFANVVLLLHGDGANSSTVFTDSSSNPKTVTRTGSFTQIRTADFKFGGASVYPSAASDTTAGDGLVVDNSVDFNFGANPFTIECWAKPLTPFTFTKRLFFYCRAGNAGIELQLAPSGALTLANSSSLGSSTSSSAAGVVVSGVWSHIAVVRNGASLSCYVNGLLVIAGAVGGGASGAFTQDPAQKLALLRGYAGAPPVDTGHWFGYVDDFRITKGIARYTNNFTIPAEAFPNAQATFPKTGDDLYANTVFWFQAEDPEGGIALRDNSFYNNPLGPSSGGSTGSTWLDYTQKIQGYSSWYNGSGGYLDTPTAAHLRMDTADFFCTIRVYRISEVPANATVALIGQNNNTATSGRWFLGYQGAAFGGGLANRAVLYADGSQRIISTATIPLNVWCEIAVSCSGGTLRLFINGNLEASVARPFSFNAAIPMAVNLGGSGAASMIGYIDNARVIKGEAVHTASYTPATLATGTFPGFTVLSLHCDTLVDSSKSPKTLALGGTASFASGQGKFGNAALSVVSTGGVTANGLTVTQHQDFNLGSVDWTLEGWVKRTSNTHIGTILSVITNNFVLEALASTGQFRWSVTTSLSNFSNRAVSYNFPLNAYVYVVVQRRGANLEVYFDGVLADTVAVPGGARATINWSTQLNIGRNGATGAQNWTGFIDDLRLTRGVARYPQAFTPPTAEFPNSAPSDPFFASVVVSAHFGGANGSATLTDSSSYGRAGTFVRLSPTDAFITTTISKYGGSSLALANTAFGAYQIGWTSSANFNISSSGTAFTIELWAYELSGSLGSLVCRRPGGTANGWVITTFQLRAIINGVYSDSQLTWSRPSFNTWHHYALVRTSSNLLTMYIDGVAVASRLAVTLFGADPGVGLFLGQADNASENKFLGYLDDFRFTVGVARYTAAFTPPALTFCDSVNSQTQGPANNKAARLTGRGLTLTQGFLTSSVSGTAAFRALMGMRLTLADAQQLSRGDTVINRALVGRSLQLGGDKRLSSFVTVAANAVPFAIELLDTRDPSIFDVNFTNDGRITQSFFGVIGNWGTTAPGTNAAQYFEIYVNVVTGRLNESIPQNTWVPLSGFQLLIPLTVTFQANIYIRPGPTNPEYNPSSFGVASALTVIAGFVSGA